MMVIASSDHTDFDESRITAIGEGETNRQGVIEVFGQPNGEYIYPMMQEESHTGLVYSYMHVDAGLLGAKQFEKRLIIAVDETDIVRDIQFSKGSAE